MVAPVKTTYWFWYGQQIVASVRLPTGTHVDTARTHALLNFDRLMLCDRPNEAPFERRYKIRAAECRTYEGGT